MSSKSSFQWDIPLSETAETAARANPFLQSLHAPNTYRAQRICEEHGFFDEIKKKPPPRTIKEALHRKFNDHWKIKEQEKEDTLFRTLLEEHLRRMRAEEVLFNISKLPPEEKAFSFMVMAKAQEFLEKQATKKAKEEEKNDQSR